MKVVTANHNPFSFPEWHCAIQNFRGIVSYHRPYVAWDTLQ